MPHLTAEDRGFFKDNGYLIKRDVLSVDQIARAQDALWEGIEADRKDPSSWIGAGPRSPASASHADIRATLHDAPVFDMAEELVGRDTLNPGAAPGPAEDADARGERALARTRERPSSTESEAKPAPAPASLLTTQPTYTE